MREQFLANACAEDQALLAEVMSLLNAAEESESYFARLSDKVGLLSRPDRAESLPDNEIIGNWRVERVIGRGGMGSVYLAARADEQFDQHAALKILPFGLDSEAARARFLTERQILADLEHPNIARLVDGGVADDGTPYFVMEYVDGVPIDAYCDSNKLRVAERIKLFLDVLGAITHAHARLVVHRDIKPSNVLVDKEGRVKLLDFGVAKLLRPEPGTPAAASTRELGVALTPEYAAPEQLLGQPVTTATDVYSLGLMLYELLSGSAPRDVSSVDSFAALIEAATRHPPKASTVVNYPEQRGSSGASLQRILKGDLDNILQKALSPEPDARYKTANEFASDLKRYLAGDVVNAIPPTFAYRARKFVSRHRGSVASAAVTLVALVAALVLATQQMLEARTQRDAAEYQRQRAEASNEFYTLLLEEMGSANRPLTAVEILDRGSNLLAKLYDADRPFMGRVHFELSRRFANINLRDREREMLALAETAARESGDDDLLSAVRCVQATAALETNVATAREIADEALAVFRRIPVPSAEAEFQCLRMTSRHAEASGERNRAIATVTAALDDPTLTERMPPFLQALLLIEVSMLHYKSAHFEKALQMLDEIMALLEAAGRGSTVTYMKMLSNKAVALAAIGEYRDALELEKQVFERFADAQWGNQQTHMPQRINHAAKLIRLSRVDEAIAMLQGARDEAQRQDDGLFVGIADLRLASAYIALDRLDTAQQSIDNAIDVLSGSPGTWDYLMLEADAMRAAIVRKQGRLDEARTIVVPLLEQLGYPSFATPPRNISLVLAEAAALEISAGNYKTAESYAGSYLDIALSKARRPELSASVGHALVLRARARYGQGQVAAAIEDLEQAIRSLSNGLGIDNTETREAETLLDNYRAILDSTDITS